MVRLKASVIPEAAAIYSDFNSNMVRLKVASLGLLFVNTPIFQFQYGSIKRADSTPVAFCYQYFNSNMVRLKE